MKLDHKLSDHDSLFARYSYAHTSAFQPPKIPIGDWPRRRPGDPGYSGCSDQLCPCFPTPVGWRKRGLVTAAMGSRVFPITSGKNLSDQVGLTGSNRDFLSSGLASFWPLEGSDIFIGDDIYVPDINTNNIYQGGGTVTHTMSSHSLRFGGEIRKRQVFQNQSPSSRGWFFFFPFQTGNAFSSLLTGYPFPSAGGRSIEINTPGYKFNEAGLFVQDDWRARPWLTLNLGLRWDYYSPISAPHQISNFDPATGRF